MQSFAITCLVTLLWYVIGYSLAFTPGTPYMGGLSRLFMNGVIYVKDVAAAAATKGHTGGGCGDREGIGQSSRCDDTRDRLRDVPADLRDHHASPDLRRRLRNE